MKSPFIGSFSRFEKTTQYGVYLDFASATPVDDRVFSVMEPYFAEHFANPSNRLHALGEIAEHALSKSRNQIASIYNVPDSDVIFTSSATEAINLFLKGLAEGEIRKWSSKSHIKKDIFFYGATEHSAVRESIFQLCQAYPALKAVELPVNSIGQLTEEFEDLMLKYSGQVLAVCLMDVNNETGYLQGNRKSIFNSCQKHGTFLFVDSSQGFGRCADYQNDIMPFGNAFCLNSGKIYGPKGCAALVFKGSSLKSKIKSQIVGGGQEFGIRSSTQNLPAIVGFAEAVRLQLLESKQRSEYLKEISTYFLQELSCFDNHRVLAASNGIITLSFKNCNAMKLIEECKTICVSSGSACKTLQATASHVLLAQGFDLETALSGIRVSFGICSSFDDAKSAARKLAQSAKVLSDTNASLSL